MVAPTANAFFPFQEKKAPSDQKSMAARAKKRKKFQICMANVFV